MSNVKVAVINPGSDVAEIRTVDRELPSLQRLVGGYIESLTLTEDVTAYINEDGKALGLAANKYGDLYVRASLHKSGRRLMPGDYIAGPVVLVGPVEDGWDTSVPDKVLAELRMMGLDVREEAAA